MKYERDFLNKMKDERDFLNIDYKDINSMCGDCTLALDKHGHYYVVKLCTNCLIETLNK